MVDPLHGIESDVRFDHSAAQSLARSCRNAADAIDGQAGSRSSWVSHGMVDFVGYYSQLFQQNGTTQAGDAERLATALREVATKVDYMAECATKEQERRVVAREWKQRQEDRHLGEHIVDFFTGGERPPFGPPDPEEPQSVPTPPAPARDPLTGSGGSGTSSARPAHLRTFASNSEGANEALAWRPGNLRGHYDDFVSGCGWGTLSAAGVFTAFDNYLTANGQDVFWANTVAAAFEEAGGEGVVTIPNASITAALQANGVAATRDDLVITMPQAYGIVPTSGYADDPVNAATGNFVEPEIDLRFTGGAATLAFTRLYNSLDDRVGAFGPGWSSWTETRLAFSDEQARWTRQDGRLVLFPRLGEAWDRATVEAYWLGREGDGYRITDNGGGTWEFDAAGQLTALHRGAGTTVRLDWVGGRLQGLSHERGRGIELVWEADRVVELRASDGRGVRYAYDQSGRLVAVTTGTGTRRYRWDAAGLLDQVTDADGVHEATNTYDATGRVTSQVSAHGRESRYRYLPGRVTVVEDPDGTRANTWIHDQHARLVGVVDAHGERQSTAWDKYGHPVMFTERDGSTTLLEYDERSRLTARVSPTGARTDHTWDAHDRLVALTLENGEAVATVEYTYEGDDRTPTAVKDGEGNVTRLRWDGQSVVGITDPTGRVIALEYDDHGDVVALVDGEGNRSVIERDAGGRVIATVTPLGHRTEFVHEGENLVERRDPDGAVWRFEYSVGGRMVASIDPYGARTVIEHDPRAITTTDPLGRRTTQAIDDIGNLAALRLPDGSTWQYTHDALSRLVAVTDPEGHQWSWEHDVNGQVTRATDPTGVATSLDRSVDRRALATAHPGGSRPDDLLVTDRIGRIESFSRAGFGSYLTRYDLRGLPIEFLGPDGSLTALERDAAGRPTTLRRPDGSVTRYTYDGAGRLASTTLPDGATHRFVYDADGRLTEEVDPTGAMTRYTYDACRRVTSIQAPGEGARRWTYDLAGRVVAMRDRMWGLRRFTYDAAGQIATATNALGGVTRFTHDALGRTVGITHPDGATWTRTFNAAGRCTSQTDPEGNTASAEYDAAGRVVANVLATGERVEYGYAPDGTLATLGSPGRTVAAFRRDGESRTLTVLDDKDPGARVTHRLRWDARGRLVERARDAHAVRWTYDVLGRCSSMTRPNGERTTYGWDAAGRMAWVEADGAGRLEFSRDAAGRVLAATGSAGTQQWAYTGNLVVSHTGTARGAEAVTTVERDEDGRVAAVVRDGVRTEYTHDAAGQLVAARSGDDVNTWSWDAAGRLVAETAAGRTTTYTYGPSGQLATRETDGVATHYTYDRAGRRTSEVGPDGRIEFTWGDLGWLTSVTGPQGRSEVLVDALGELSRVDDVDVFWDTARQPGAPVQVGPDSVTRAAGSVAGHDQWLPSGWRGVRGDAPDPWEPGSADALGGGLTLGPAGEVVLGGLEWLGKRVHDPATRSFLSRDPLDPVFGSGWSGNPYSYAGNNPLHALDPTGLSPLTDQQLTDWITAYDAQHAQSVAMFVGGALLVAGAVALTIAAGPAAPLVATMLIGSVGSMGADLIQQSFSGEPFDPLSLGLSAVTGLIPGSFGGNVWARVGSGAAIGGVTNAGSTALTGWITGDPASWQDIGISALWGAGFGGVFGGVDHLASNVFGNSGGPDTPSTAPAPAVEAPDIPAVQAAEAVVTAPAPTVTPTAPVAVPTAPTAPPAPSPLLLEPPAPSLLVPEPPAGMSQTPGGLYVFDDPPGFDTSPGGLLVPAGSAG